VDVRAAVTHPLVTYAVDVDVSGTEATLLLWLPEPGRERVLEPDQPKALRHSMRMYSLLPPHRCRWHGYWL
jgi:hypothetical protein